MLFSYELNGNIEGNAQICQSTSYYFPIQSVYTGRFCLSQVGDMLNSYTHTHPGHIDLFNSVTHTLDI